MKSTIDQNSTFNEAFFPAQTYAVPADQGSFSFGATQDFTIEFWVKPNAFTGDPSLISNKNWISGYNPGFIISTYQGQYWKVNVGDGFDRLDISGGNLTANEWRHLAVSFDRDGLMTAYEDGVFVGFEKMDNIDNIDTGLPLVINQDGTTSYGYNLNASYKDVRIWNTVIPDSIISEWATIPVTSSHPYYNDLIANWQCEDGSGTVLQDQTQNNNNCTTTGAISWASGQNNTFTVYDHSETTREPDNAVNALTWLCIPILSSWNLDGKNYVSPCSGISSAEEIAASIPFEIELHPNPTTDDLNVTFESTSHTAKIIIINDKGQSVYEKDVFSYNGNYVLAIDIKNLNRGTYSLTVRIDETYSSTRFVK